MKAYNEILKPFGLYSAQWTVLYVLKTKGTLTQSELCDYLAIEAPPMTRTIQKLVSLGLVIQVTGEDRRSKKISLSEKALNLYPEWEKSVVEMNNQLLNQVSPARQVDLQQNLLAFVQMLKQQEEMQHGEPTMD
ncbi:MarR family transcriptional regulator [Bacillus sp. BGMRC 2118]|nr:MarR family transcriptional regulator [Bacillus sp. BGMRC 2118]